MDAKNGGDSTEGQPHSETEHIKAGRLFDYESMDESLPDYNDLISKLRFVPTEGRIWLDTHRVTLVNLSTFGWLKQELIDTIGSREARNLLTRMGYTAGGRDAELARNLPPKTSTAESFMIGPQLRALKGGAFFEPIRIEAKIDGGHFDCEFVVKDSYEVDSHLSAYGLSSTPVCWQHSGYLSGYASGIMGKAILFREVECRAMGAEHCRMIGRPISEMEDADIDIQALQPEEFANIHKRLRHGQTTTKIGNLGGEPPLGRYKNMMVGASPEFAAACHRLQKVAGTPATVLIRGETGTGKEIFFQTLHSISNRADKPFVTVNCAAIPDNLIEAELFGVERGAYTGAVKTRPGRFERANGGTLFLDEIGTLTPPAQIKLLRAIQEGEIERVGGTSTIKIDVRLVAATNAELEDAVEAGDFREDLYYRINVFSINLPPLRNRRDDIPLLMDYFLSKFTEFYEKRITGFTTRAVDALYEYDYPGNIRELENMIEQAVISAEEDSPIDLGDLFGSRQLAATTMMRLDGSGTLHPTANTSKNWGSLEDLLDEIQVGTESLGSLEVGLMRLALERAGGNVSAAARLLQIPRTQIAYRLKKENISG